MRRKHFYTLVLICSFGMLSLANQTSRDCKKIVYCAPEMKSSGCTTSSMRDEAGETNKMNVTPLNLLLFDL